MTQSEKRYFKLNAQHNQKGKGNYILLFDLIDKRGTDRRTPLSRDVSSQVFLRQLPTLRHTLYEQLLRSLASFHKKSSASLQIRDLLDQVEVLAMKGMYDEAGKILKKSQKLASQYEKHEFLIAIAKWDEALVDIQVEEGESEARIQELLKLKVRSFEVLENLSQYKSLYFKLAHVVSHWGIFAGTERETTAVSQHPLLADPSNALSTEALIYYNYIWYGIHGYVDPDIPKARAYIQKTVALFEHTHPGWIYENQALYIKALYHMGLVAPAVDAYQTINETLEKIQTIEARSENMEWIRQGRIMVLTGLSWNFREKNEQLLAEVESMARQVEGARKFLPSSIQSLIYRHISAIYFSMGKYREAQAYCHFFLNDKVLRTRFDGTLHIKYLTILLHYESGDHALLTSTLSSAETMFRKKGKLYPLEEATLRFFKKVLKGKNFPEIPERLLTEFTMDIENIAYSNSSDKIMVRVSGIREWIKTKTETGNQ
ncbi:MAG: hypothetical protein KDD36_03465 [Flavobacteriales bacterium]|nr:hypothetical protein [Flavobacteriales bacterium]